MPENLHKNNNSILYIILLLILLLLILFNYKQENNVDSLVPLSNEAIQNISSVYNNQDMKVTNMTATGIIKGNLRGDVSGNVRGDVSGNVTGNVKGDVIGNKITINDNGMVMWRQRVRNGMPRTVQATDPSGNTYNADKWVIYSGGIDMWGEVCASPFIDKNTNTWFLYMYSTHYEWEWENFLDVFAIPIGYFSNFYSKTFVKDRFSLEKKEYRGTWDAGGFNNNKESVT